MAFFALYLGGAEVQGGHSSSRNLPSTSQSVTLPQEPARVLPYCGRNGQIALCCNCFCEACRTKIRFSQEMVVYLYKVNYWLKWFCVLMSIQD